MRRFFIVIFIIFCVLTVWDYKDKYEVAFLPDGMTDRNDNSPLCHPELVSGSNHIISNDGFGFD